MLPTLSDSNGNDGAWANTFLGDFGARSSQGLCTILSSVGYFTRYILFSAQNWKGTRRKYKTDFVLFMMARDPSIMV
jgi:hypothetical protein